MSTVGQMLLLSAIVVYREPSVTSFCTRGSVKTATAILCRYGSVQLYIGCLAYHRHRDGEGWRIGWFLARSDQVERRLDDGFRGLAPPLLGTAVVAGPRREPADPWRLEVDFPSAFSAERPVTLWRCCREYQHHRVSLRPPPRRGWAVMS